jgi:tetratricopeptide (TPR) repeat protein
MDGAPVRELSQKDAYRLDDYPLGSVIHVIGELPSGWLQVAREGKPFGWVHASAMRPEKKEQAAAKAAPGAKPAIYIASPKPGDEVAEPVVRILGYVTSANRTEDLRVYVNHRLVPTQSLWSDTPIQARGLRGFPLKLTVPLGSGDNKIEVHVLDQQGFLVNQALSVRRIDITEAARPAAVTDLPARLADVAVAERTQAVSADNFMAVLGSWVKDTAKTDYNKGNSMFDAGRFARAAYYYRKSIKTEPMGQAWFNLGISEQALGDAAKARQAFAAACRMKVAPACGVGS